MSITETTDIDPRVELTTFIREQAERTADEFGFRWVGVADAPSTYQQLRGAFEHSQATGEPLPVSNEHCDSSIFLSPEDNMALRFCTAVHHHTGGAGSRGEAERK